MKQSVRFQALIIPNKLNVNVRISVDDRNKGLFTSTNNGDRSVVFSLFPIITLSIIRPPEINENGERVRAPWNANDNLTMTKYTMPIFINNLINIREALKTPELYTYRGKRLELNEAVAENIRNPFMIGNTTVELSAVVIETDDNRIEGIKLKFNNEQSSVLLSINDADVLIYNLTHLDIDNLVMTMYTNFIEKNELSSYDPAPKVDILPKTNDLL